MTPDASSIVVGGHICLDIIPTLSDHQRDPGDFIVPGKLSEVGPATVGLGGPVSNVGFALYKLGTQVRLVGKVGDDVLGRAVVDTLRRHDSALAELMVVVPGEASSYTVVINPPGVDRAFLHSPGANDTFVAADIPYDKLGNARIFHFGYPPLMRRFHQDGGEQAASMFAQVKKLGMVTSLDMATPDPDSPAGQVDWTAWLQNVLPHVDIFAPSVGEILYMLDRPRFDELVASAGEADLPSRIDAELLADLGRQLLDWGAAVIVLKLGDQGLYLRSGKDAAARLATGLPNIDEASWNNRELVAPCFRIDVVGTTGSGDATIAGFLAALARGAGPEEAAVGAVAVGASGCEAADSTGGIGLWSEIEQRIDSGWPMRDPPQAVADWPVADDGRCRLGPHNGR